MSGTVIEMLINSLTFFFFDNFSRHKQWRMHKPDSSLLSNAGRYEAIFLFPLKIVRLDYFWDFIVLFTEKLKFHTNYRCKNCIKLKMHMLLVECVKPYNSFENRMKKCTWNCIEMIFLKIDCIWACASIQTLPESKSNENWKNKFNQFDYHSNPKKYKYFFFLFEDEWVKSRCQL